MLANRNRPHTWTTKREGRASLALSTLRAMSIWTFPLDERPYHSALSVTAAIIGRKLASCKEGVYIHH